MNLGYIISTIIASLILLSLVGLNSRIMRSSGEQTLYTMAKIQSDMVLDYVKDDMRSMGYRIETTNPITLADENRIRFLVHFENRVDTTSIEWHFAETPVGSGRNPNVRPLYRIENGGDEIAIGSGIVDFRLVYLNSARDTLTAPVSNPGEIRHIGLEVITESLDSYDANRFERSTWSGVITPFNLRPPTN